MEHIKTNQIKKQIEAFISHKDELITTVRRYCTDKSVDVNERLEVFFSSDIGGTSTWIKQFNTLLEYGLEDELYTSDRYSRHQVVEIEDLIERLEENLIAIEEWNTKEMLLKDKDPSYIIEEYETKYGLNLEEFYNKDNKSFDRSALASFKEEVLSKFYKSFTMDW